ncbi:hypothetical protein [Candidatus Oscillochloris fontis]|uniref:hypothetical protein n=1 Tax=Candidatus Oscillochloris fontis TaxID=2496868 RepID=UPI00101B90B3|nr:hypothetical protein [Candidatus Oscillochloris fontis]
MTIEDILIRIPRLTTREQLLLLEAVSRALRTDMETFMCDPNRSAEDSDDRRSFWNSFGAWKQSPGEPTLEVLVAERLSKQEPPTL